MSLAAARAVADAVLYEGYLLYPYRASAAKNRSRWQFGVLGPPACSAAAFGEPPSMAMQCLVTAGAHVTLHLRFLHLQVREVQRRSSDGYEPVAALTVAGETFLSWDEAVEHEHVLPPLSVHPGLAAYLPVTVPGAREIEDLRAADGTQAGRIVRRRWPLTARIHIRIDPAAPAPVPHRPVPDGPVADGRALEGSGSDGSGPSSAGPVGPDAELLRLSVTVTNKHPEPVADKESAVRHSLLGAHLLLETHDGDFVSLVDPPASAVAAAARCVQERCWPVLAGPPGTADLLLAAPIILYDHPQVAAESPGALFDLTEIDEILALRVRTMTDAEKAEARATDPRARAVVDQCDDLHPTTLARLHGARRDPSAPADPPGSDSDVPVAAGPPDAGAGRDVSVATGSPGAGRDVAVVAGSPGAGSSAGEVPWWDPGADASVDPGSDTVLVAGVPIGKDSLVVLRPTRRADAQDLFLDGRPARVTAVLSDVDGGHHVAVVLTDDPDADLHDWYGRYYYFAPDELEPAGPPTGGENRP